MKLKDSVREGAIAFVLGGFMLAVGVACVVGQIEAIRSPVTHGFKAWFEVVAMSAFGIFFAGVGAHVLWRYILRHAFGADDTRDS